MSKSIQKRNSGDPDPYKNLHTQPRGEYESGGVAGALDPKTIVLTIWRYKCIVLLFLLIGGGGAWYYAGTLDRVYQTRGTMLISAGDRGGNNELSRLMTQATGVGVNTSLANELQILGSMTFARQVAEKFLEKHQGEPDEFPILWRYTEVAGYLPANEGTVAGRIRNDMEFQLVNRDAEVIEIRFKSTSPQEAAAVINIAMDTYVEASTVQNRRTAEETSKFLAKERETLRQALDESEEKLKSFMDLTGIVRVDQQSSTVVNRRNQIEAEMEELELDLEGVKLAISNQEREMERIKPGLLDDFSNAVAPRIRSFQDQLGEYERERYLILSRNPGVRDREVTPPRLAYLDKQIEDLKDQIAELSQEIFSEEDEYMGMETAERTQMVTQIQGRLIELRMQKQQLESRVAVVQQRKEEIDRNFQQLPNEMLELVRLQREVEMNEQLYLNVSEHYADMTTWKETQHGFGRVIDQASIPGGPVSPRVPVILVMGILFGGMAAAAVITLREFFDNSINNMSQVKATDLPMLATVPSLNKRLSVKNGSKSSSVSVEMVVLRERASIMSESIRRLKNNIIYQNSNEPPKTIAITSAEKGDGKSTVVCNLAAAFAEEGFKTLLIDTDFRRPKVHSYFGLNNKAGVTNYLNKEAQLQQIIQPTDLHHLKVITTGSRLDRPELISSSDGFMKFLDKMEEVFDVIVMDTPPYGIISDSTALLKRVESTIVVAKYRKTSKAVFMHTIEELERIKANVSGFVLNEFDPRKDTSGYYGSAYYKSVYQGYEEYAHT